MAARKSPRRHRKSAKPKARLARKTRRVSAGAGARRRKKALKTAQTRRKAARRPAAARKTARRAKARRPARKPARRTAPKRSRPAARPARPATPQGKARRPGRPAKATGAHPPALDRTRRILSDEERLENARRGRSETSDDRMISMARAGHDELAAHLRQHTETSPELTAGDIDARWEDAYAVGDEAPGGDNPTPDQDRVDDIGRALGIRYEDNQELQGGEEVSERDRHRWELDPASSEDWSHKK